MLQEIKNKIEQELKNFITYLDRTYSLRKISPLLFNHINEFILRKGKRTRPILFMIGYLGFSKKIIPGLYTSALSLELLHDFMLIHDDIIDKSDTRRGKPSMHKILNKYLSNYKNCKFNGEDLSIVIGDIMYAMGIHAFLSVKADIINKEKALKLLIEAAIYTGNGEFLELLLGLKDIQETTILDIYKIYDFKTAYYTFAIPLAMGATLAGATQKQIDILLKYGIYLGRAFQIKDDVLGMFGNQKTIGKSTLTDLQEGKKTILIWRTYNKANRKEKLILRKILAKKKIRNPDLLKIRQMIIKAGALDYTKKEVSSLIKKAHNLTLTSTISLKYKNLLGAYSQELLRL